MRAIRVFALLCFTLFTLKQPAHAQVAPASQGFTRQLWGGVEGSSFQNDYVKYIRSDGIGFYGDYLITPHFGLEGEVRLLDLNDVEGLTEKTYFAGPIVNAYRHHPFAIYGKFLAGVASANYPPNEATFLSASGSYFAIEFGGGVEYRLKPRWKLRGEYVQQDWINAPDLPGIQNNGLTPKGFSGGISYKIF